MTVKLSAALIQLAFDEAVQDGNLAEAQRWLHQADPQYQNSRALGWAAARGDLSMVDLLLPVSDPQAGHSHALTCAIDQGHIEVAQRLIPVSDLSVSDF